MRSNASLSAIESSLLMAFSRSGGSWSAPELNRALLRAAPALLVVRLYS